MRTSARRYGLLAAATIVGGAAWFAPPTSNELVLPVDRLRSREAEGSAPAIAKLAALPKRTAIGEQTGDMFGLHSWAPSQVAATPPPKASTELPAPKSPYSVVGTVLVDGAPSVYLAKGERIYEAKPGLELDGGYRVESVSGEEVILLYVPLGAKLSLPYTTTLTERGELAATEKKPVDTAIVALSVPASKTVPEGPAKPAQIRWEGPATVRAGSAFSVSLHVSSARSLRASPMLLRFAPDMLESLNVRAGRFYGQGSFSYRVNPEGTIFVGASGNGATPGADAELVVLTFRPRQSGSTTEISLGSLALEDSSGQALAHDSVSVFRTTIQ